MSLLLHQVFLSVMITLTLSYRCQYEKHLETGTNSTHFLITPQRDLNGRWLWITNMNVFLFGKLAEGSDAKLHAGFYDTETGVLVYKVIVNCGDKTWKTMYDPNGNGKKAKKWKEGALTEGCPAGQFDLIASVGCPHWLDEDSIAQEQVKCAKQAYFIFNGQVLETDLVTDTRGRPRTAELPVFIRKGRKFQARVVRTGMQFTSEAYGKCFAFPEKYSADCSAAKEWMNARNDRYKGLDYLGAWDMGYTVECQDNSHLFKTVQRKIVPDGGAIKGDWVQRTTCCSYTDGVVDPATCRIGNVAYTDMEKECSDHNLAFSKF